jgi:hypothetical protein
VGKLLYPGGNWVQLVPSNIQHHCMCAYLYSAILVSRRPYLWRTTLLHNTVPLNLTFLIKSRISLSEKYFIILQYLLAIAIKIQTHLNIHKLCKRSGSYDSYICELAFLL